MGKDPRDRTYIRKDIMFMLGEYGELNLTRLIGYCGLNMTKHKEILDDMEKKELITKTEESWGSKTIRKYKLAPKGLDFYQEILEPYEKMFPRTKVEEDE